MYIHIIAHTHIYIYINPRMNAPGLIDQRLIILYLIRTSPIKQPRGVAPLRLGSRANFSSAYGREFTMCFFCGGAQGGTCAKLVGSSATRAPNIWYNCWLFNPYRVYLYQYLHVCICNDIYDGLPTCFPLVLLINRSSLRAASYYDFKTMTDLNSLKPCILSIIFEAVAKTCSKC